MKWKPEFRRNIYRIIVVPEMYNESVCFGENAANAELLNIVDRDK